MPSRHQKGRLMNKQQLSALETTLQEGTILANDHDPVNPLEDGGPYTYVIHFDRGAGQYLLDLTLWSDYYHYPSTREQPEEEGWATQENIAVWSPYLSELLQELEDRGIPLPLPSPTPLPYPPTLPCPAGKRSGHRQG